MITARKILLVVDDDADIREAFRDFLEEMGYQVSCAADGAEALACLRQAPRPCLILLDVMMPRMDGREFRRRQLEDEAVSDIPVVLVTADPRLAIHRASFEDAESFDVFGNLERIAKPFAGDELLRVVKKYC